jgi:hypothetical protein
MAPILILTGDENVLSLMTPSPSHSAPERGTQRFAKTASTEMAGCRPQLFARTVSRQEQDLKPYAKK